MDEFSFSRIFQTIGDNIGGFLPSLLAALAVLLAGWIVALLISRLLGRGLRRLSLNERLGRWVGEPAGGVDVEGGVSRVVFWLLMILVLVAFFQILGLTLITEPLNNLLNQVFGYLPQLIGAAILLLIAWVIASIVRVLVRQLIRVGRLEERFGLQAEAAEAGATPFSQTIGNAAYWLTLLLFLPAVVGALALEGLLGPVQGMVDNVLTFLPNILAAALILVVGWFIARILRRVSAGLLASIGTDRLSERVGVARALGEQRLSELLGLIIYALVLIPVLIGALNALQLDAVTEPTSNMLDAILAAIPNIFAATLVIGIAFVVGRLVAGLISRILAGLGFNRVLVWLGVGEERGEGAWTPSTVVGYFALVAVMLFATIEGSRLLGFAELADLIARFTVFAAQILFGLVILGIGLFLANLAARAIQGSGVGNARLLSIVGRVSILVLAGAMALLQMGIADEVVVVGFAVLGGAIAVATALAFGLGGREQAGRLLDDWLRNIRGRGR